MSTLAVVDFSNLFWTHVHAAGDELVSHAVTKTVNYIRNLMGTYDHVAIAADKPPYLRTEMFPHYKAHRPPKQVAHIAMMRRAAADCRALGAHLFAADGYEADDILATFVNWNWEPLEDDEPPRFGRVDLITRDKDCWQLLADTRVVMVDFSTGQRFTEEDLRKKHDIRPNQVPDWLALVGDRADGIPGVEGCGEKKASWLLHEFGDIDGIRKMLATGITAMGGKKALASALLKANTPMVEGDISLALWRTLATLQDAPINCGRVLGQPVPTVEEDLPPEEDSPLEAIEPAKPKESPMKDAEPAPVTPSEVIVVPDLQWSQPCGQLAAALAAAQLKMQKVTKGHTAKIGNSHSYKYATLDDVQEACGPFFEQGIAIIQMPGSKAVQTVLMHKSGEWLKSQTPIEYNGGGPQKYGSAVTYARRYALAAITGIRLGEDDDGAQAQARYSGR